MDSTDLFIFSTCIY